MLTGRKLAASSRTAVVPSETSLSAHDDSGQAHRPLSVRDHQVLRRQLQFRALRGEGQQALPGPGPAGDQGAPPDMGVVVGVEGLPHSSITKLVMSTTLLIGRTPAACRRSCIHPGEGPMVTPGAARR